MKTYTILTCWDIVQRQTIATKEGTILTCSDIEQRQRLLHQIWPSPPQLQVPEHDDDGDIDDANDDIGDACGDEDGYIIGLANKSLSTPQWRCQ